MLRQNIEEDNKKNAFQINYHVRPVGKTFGHVTVFSRYNGDEQKLNVNGDRSPATVLAKIATFTRYFLLPSKAFHNQPINTTDIIASYDITETIPDHKSAHEKIIQLNQKIESGKVGYSLVPTVLSHSSYTLFSRDTSMVRFCVGMKTLDRQSIRAENCKTTNCVDSLDQVLEAGHYKKIKGYFPLTPSKVNDFFENQHKKAHKMIR